MLPLIADLPERGVYAASSFGIPQGKRFVYARSKTKRFLNAATTCE